MISEGIINMNSPSFHSDGLMLGTDNYAEEGPLKSLQEYTELNLLTNMVYFFIILVICGTILGGALFGIREYQISYLRRVQSSRECKELTWDVGEYKVKNTAANEIIELTEVVAASAALKPTGEGLVQEGKYFQPLNTPDYENYLITTNFDDPVHILDILEENVDSPSFMISLTKHSNSCEKVLYDYDELLRIRRNIGYSSLFSGTNRQIRMSALTRYSTPIPRVQFANAWRAESTIMEFAKLISNVECDVASRSIGIFGILAIGASYQLHDNVNYWLRAFNEFMDKIFDAETIFKMAVAPSSLVQYVDLLMAYSWSHWNYSEYISEKLESWKVRPYVQSHNSIYNMVIRFRIGMITWKASGQREMEFRVSTLIKECSRTTHCNEYIGLITILTLALISSGTIIFYEALQILVQSHGECCMKEYLRDDNTDLRKILQHGLWYKNSKPIIQISNEICDYLVDKANITRWVQEITGERIYTTLGESEKDEIGELDHDLGAKSSTKTLSDSMGAKTTCKDDPFKPTRADTKRHFQRQRSVTPGSWKLNTLPSR
jgi:hypothetical protein